MSMTDDVIAEGLANYVRMSGDQREIQLGAGLYKALAEAFRVQISDGNSCSLAFSSMIVRPDIRTSCFVAVLDSKVVVAWKKGIFKKVIQCEPIPKNRISSVEVETSSSGATRGATLMKVTAGGTTTTFALPKGRPDIWEAIRKAILLNA
jgi:hypothetical protein